MREEWRGVGQGERGVEGRGQGERSGGEWVRVREEWRGGVRVREERRGVGQGERGVEGSGSG